MKVNVNVRSHTTHILAVRQSPQLLIAVIFFGVGIPLFLWHQIGFAIYAATGSSWIHTNGSVINSHTTDVPMIRFTTCEGSQVTFKEDYYLTCHRSPCFVRYFEPSQVVPVIYDPNMPTRAYVYDLALFSNTIEWFVMAGIFLFFVSLLLGVSLPISANNSPARLGRSLEEE